MLARLAQLTTVLSLALALAPPAQAESPRIGPEVPALEAIAHDAIGLLNQHLSPALSIPVTIGWLTNRAPGDNSPAYTNQFSATEGIFHRHYYFCQIAVNEPVYDGYTSANASWAEEIITHELFHCYQHQLLPDPDTYNTVKAWITEGLPRWVDTDLFSSNPIGVSLGSLQLYFASSTVPLFARSYDAVGFWGHVQDVAGDLWSRIPAIIRASPSSYAAIDAALKGVSVERFYDTWGSSAANDRTGGMPWMATSPYPPSPYMARVYDVNAANSPDTTVNVKLEPYSTDQLHIAMPPAPAGDIETVRIDLGGAYGRFGLVDNFTGSELEGATFCGAGSACTQPTPATGSCPGGQTGTVPPLPPLTTIPADGLLGVASAASTSTVQIIFTPLPDSPSSATCPPATGVGGNSAVSAGDPHLVDFGGDLFDFQGVGDFTLLESTRDDLQIQARQQAIPHLRDVAVTTETAFRDGTATVEVDAAGGQAVVAYVNRRRVGGGRQRLGGGGFVSVGRDSVTVGWADGTQAVVKGTFDGPSFAHLVPSLGISIAVAGDRDGHLTGLLGDAGVPEQTEFASRAGTVYPASEIVGQNTSILYGPFGRSWQIEQLRSSLFRSTTPENLKADPFPSQGALAVEILELFERSAGAYSAAERICAALHLQTAAGLSACELDVGETGNAGYATGDAAAAAVSAANVRGASSILQLPAERTSPTGNFFTLEAYDPPTATSPYANFEMKVCASANTPAGTSVEPALFTLSLSAGTSLMESPFGALQPILAPSPLAPNQCVEGWLSFTVPPGGTVSTLEYSYNGTISWTVG